MIDWLIYLLFLCPKFSFCLYVFFFFSFAQKPVSNFFGGKNRTKRKKFENFFRFLLKKSKNFEFFFSKNGRKIFIHLNLKNDCKTKKFFIFWIKKKVEKFYRSIGNRKIFFLEFLHFFLFACIFFLTVRIPNDKWNRQNLFS